MNTHNVQCKVTHAGFENVAKNRLRGLFEDQEFVDVTLACEGGKLIKAHKVVLATSSTALEQIFMDSRHMHQIVYLKGVQINILEALIRFIYLGEVKVETTDFDSFIALARELDVDGLDERVRMENDSDFIDNNIGNVDNILNATFYSRENQTSDYLKSESVSGEDMKDDSLASSFDINKFNENKEKIDLYSSPQFEPSVDQIISNPDINSPEDEARSKEITENKINTPSSFYQCDKCDFLTVYKVSLKKHILFRHEGITHPCTNCDSVFSCQASLKQHVKAKHEGIRFPCDLCEFKATSLSLVRKHKTKTHEKIN